jgi:cell division protein FtsW (lipid II flippase)
MKKETSQPVDKILLWITLLLVTVGAVVFVSATLGILARSEARFYNVLGKSTSLWTDRWCWCADTSLVATIWFLEKVLILYFYSHTPFYAFWYLYLDLVTNMVAHEDGYHLDLFHFNLQNF